MMPKAILTFRLPQEGSELQDALNGWKWRSILQDLEQRLKHVGGAYEIRRLLNDLVIVEGLELFD